MKRIALPFAALLVAAVTAVGGEFLPVTNYSLSFRLFPEEHRMSAEARVKVVNTTGSAVPEIPLLLHRLLEVSRILDASGRNLEFSHSIVKFQDEPTWQVNAVSATLPTPLAPGQDITLVIDYGGSFTGYPEVMQYVKDCIDEEYTLIRPDGLSYPIVSRPSTPDLRASYRSEFTFEIHAAVPAGYTVACGGRLLSKTTTDSTVTFSFESKGPVSRMDIAAARFGYLRDDASDLSVYCLPEDTAGGAVVLSEMKLVIALYTSLFGATKSLKGYAGIEIPDGWGSQADKYSFLQTAAAFKEGRVSEVYHEISHTWNARAKPDVQRCRWFDEAFAMYFESLAIKAFKGDSAFRAHLDDLRARWVKSATSEKKNFDTPIAGYGKEELGGNSYTKGAWSLYVLNEVVGDDAFRKIVRALLAEYNDKPADFRDFQNVAQKESARDLTRFFDEWLYGVESSRLLTGALSVVEMAKRY